MKKERNCGMNPYPIYGQYQMPTMMPMPPGIQMDSYQMNNNDTVAQLQRQISNLETRVSKIENSLNTINNNYTSNYSNGNYHIV